MKMNNIDLLKKLPDGTEIRRNLLEFLEAGHTEGIAEVCRIPPEIMGMSMLVPGSNRVSNFKVYEFANPNRLVKIHPALIIGLQATRDGLNEKLGGGVGIFLTSGFRSHVDQRRLAVDQKLGWTDEGGLVARNSMHTHGCAADFHAWNYKANKRVDKRIVYEIAEIYFDYVKKYSNTQHVHADARYTAGILKR